MKFIKRPMGDVETCGPYQLFPIIRYEGPTQKRVVKWYATYKGKKLSGQVSKREAKRLCERHNIEN